MRLLIALLAILAILVALWVSPLITVGCLALGFLLSLGTSVLRHAMLAEQLPIEPPPAENTEPETPRERRKRIAIQAVVILAIIGILVGLLFPDPIAQRRLLPTLLEVPYSVSIEYSSSESAWRVTERVVLDAAAIDKLVELQGKERLEQEPSPPPAPELTVPPSFLMSLGSLNTGSQFVGAVVSQVDGSRQFGETPEGIPFVVHEFMSRHGWIATAGPPISATYVQAFGVPYSSSWWEMETINTIPIKSAESKRVKLRPGEGTRFEVIFPEGRIASTYPPSEKPEQAKGTDSMRRAGEASCSKFSSLRSDPSVQLRVAHRFIRVEAINEGVKEGVTGGIKILMGLISTMIGAWIRRTRLGKWVTKVVIPFFGKKFDSKVDEDTRGMGFAAIMKQHEERNKRDKDG